MKDLSCRQPIKGQSRNERLVHLRPRRLLRRRRRRSSLTQILREGLGLSGRRGRRQVTRFHRRPRSRSTRKGFSIEQGSGIGLGLGFQNALILQGTCNRFAPSFGRAHVGRGRGNVGKGWKGGLRFGGRAHIRRNRRAGIDRLGREGTNLHTTPQICSPLLRYIYGVAWAQKPSVYCIP